MHRFIVEDAAEELLFLDEDESKHAKNVLRVRKGENVEILDGMGRKYLAEVEDVSGKRVGVRKLEELPGNESPVRITLYQGLPKMDKLDFVVHKATELGAARIVPVEMERSVARISADAAKKQDRLVKIAREAAKQCGRACVPEVMQPISWKKALEDIRARELMLIPWEEASGKRLADVKAAYPDARDIGILVGPEGGIAPEEIAQVECECVTLGPRILRTETAAVAALAIAMGLWGDV